MRSFWWVVAGATVSALIMGSSSGATVASEGPVAHGTAGPATDQHAAVTPASPGSTGQVTSRNWAGYVSLPAGRTSTFTTVRSTWVQPKVTCPTRDAWTVFWVGLDGWLDNTVEQGGSSARCIGGVPHYQTWWEMYPTNSIQTVDTIKAGDTITATVTYAPATGKYTIVVTDVTTKKGFTRVQTCASGITCARTSAEVIAEDVGHFGAGSYFPLAKYQPVTFKNTVEKNKSGTAGAFASAAWANDAITESSGGVTYATVGPLSNAGKNFTATWRHQ